MEKPVAVEHLGRRLGILVVPFHHVRPFDAQFTGAGSIRVHHFILHVVKYGADRSRHVRVQARVGHARRAFREAITFKHRDAHLLKSFQHRERRGRAPDAQQPQFAAKRLDHFLADHALETDAQQSAREQAFLKFFRNARVQLLRHQRHRQQDGRLQHRHVLGDRPHGTHKAAAAADAERQHEISRERKRMKQRQHIQEVICRIKPDPFDRGGDIRREIGVRQHGTFGLARGARSVNDRGDVAGMRRVNGQPSLRRAQRRRISLRHAGVIRAMRPTVCAVCRVRVALSHPDDRAHAGKVGKRAQDDVP